MVIYSNLSYDILSYLRSAIKHWLHFLNHYCGSDGIQSLKPVRDASTIPYDMLDSHLLGGYATYLSTIARGNCDQRRPLLAFKSADSYFSAIKTYYTVYIFSNEFNRPVFQRKLGHICGASLLPLSKFESGTLVRK